MTALVVGLLTMAATPAAAAPPMGGGSISGQVTDSNGTPLPGICVSVQNGPSTTTDGGGDYSFTGLPPGDVLVQYQDCTDAAFLDQWYLGQPDSSSATPVLVIDGVDRPLSTVAMTAGATISGTVTRAGSGGPLSGICVNANIPSPGGFSGVGGTTTAPDGTYTLTRLPAEQVRVLFADCGTGVDVPTWNGDQSYFDDAPLISLSPGSVVSGVDAHLQAGVAVSGTVTDGNGTPLSGIDVNVNPTDQGPSGWAQTDGSGTYRTSPVPVGDYTVEFDDAGAPPAWATQYWGGAVSQDTAAVLHLVPADTPERHGVDAVLTAGATVSGTVTQTGGGPAVGVCVDGLVPGAAGSGPSDVASTTTASDGTYSLGGLPSTAVELRFGDCGGESTHVTQWWSGAATSSTATAIMLAAGETRTGVDAVLTLAGRITGTVTDGNGAPVQGECVQASNDTAVAGLTGTDAAGHYTLPIAQPGAYRVQFVDCSDPHRYVGQWYPGQAAVAGAQAIAVAAGQTVTGIDATVSLGPTGSISGRVVNRHGVAMTGVCVVAYLPDQYALFATVGADGTYTVADVPSGTYAIVFLECPQGNRDPSPVVPDPESPDLSYQGVFWGGRTVVLPQGGDESVDPVAEGATLVSIGAGQQATGFDQCFGCLAISITSVTPGAGSLTVSFSVTQPVIVSSAPGVSDTGVTYTASCASSDGGRSGSASSGTSPITVAGLTDGAYYTCSVLAADQVSTIGTSPVSVSAVVPAPTTAPTAPSAAAAPSADPPATARLLAATGSGLTSPLDLAGTALVLAGVVLSLLGRRQRPG